MTNPSFTIVIDNHQVQCDSAESVIALLRAAGSPMKVSMKSASAPGSASTATAPKKRRGRAKGSKNKPKAAAATSATAAPTAAPKKRGRKAAAAGKRTFKKSAGLSKRSVAFLNEFSRSGGSTLTAERLAKATGAKGAKGVGGSLTALDRELKSFGYSIDKLVTRTKSLEEGTTWNSTPTASSLVNEILGKVPVV